MKALSRTQQLQKHVQHMPATSSASAPKRSLSFILSQAIKSQHDVFGAQIPQLCRTIKAPVEGAHVHRSPFVLMPGKLDKALIDIP